EEYEDVSWQRPHQMASKMSHGDHRRAQIVCLWHFRVVDIHCESEYPGILKMGASSKKVHDISASKVVEEMSIFMSLRKPSMTLFSFSRRLDLALLLRLQL
ncbi:hypothetical protein PENTCL1PPCAC_9153, partial [Pristionchus entomophagus]